MNKQPYTYHKSSKEVKLNIIIKCGTCDSETYVLSKSQWIQFCPICGTNFYPEPSIWVKIKDFFKSYKFVVF